MNEEKQKILKMLEEGKITSEEAVRLIEALTDENLGVENIINSISKIVKKELKKVSEVIDKSFDVKEGFRQKTKREYTFKGISSLNIDILSGDTSITGTEKENIIVNTGGNVIQKEETLFINSLNKDIDCLSPKNINIRLKELSGDSMIENIYGDILIQNHSGDCTLKNIEGNINIKATAGDIQIEHIMANISIDVVGGDVYIEHSENLDGNINAVSGDIVLSKIKNVTIHAETRYGEIKIANKHEKMKRKNKHTIGDGPYILYVKTKSGDIIIKEAE